MNRKRLTILGLTVSVVALIIVTLWPFQREEAKPKEVEYGGSHSVAVLNSKRLGEILLQKQYAAVRKEISNYTQSQISKTVKTATVIGDPFIDSSGNIRIELKTDQPENQFVVIVDRSISFDKLGFEVVGTSYKKTLLVYGSDDTGD